jgi:Xaa-Pro dipeptidase
MDVFQNCFFTPASKVVDSLRQYKDAHEIELLKKAGDIADQVMEKVRHEIRPGLSEKELSLFIENSYKQLSDDISFKPIIASGPNSASPHHNTGERTFKEGDFIVVDCGGMVSGYCSDITRTFCLGKADQEMKNVYKAVCDANQKAFEATELQCSGEEADTAARDIITQAGYGPYFIHRTGHGIGMDVHEAPYLVAGNEERLMPGMVFSIEPGIYLAGKYGVRIEDIVAVTENGPLRLNNFPRELIEL